MGEQSLELSQHKERDYLDTLSRAYLGRGDKTKAMSALNEAIALTPIPDRDPWLQRLTEYER